MINFIPKIENGTITRYHVYRNNVQTALSVSNEHTLGNYTFALIVYRQAIDFLNYDTKPKITAKEEDQFYNFFLYGKINSNKRNNLVARIHKAEQNLKKLKEQLAQETNNEQHR